MKKNLLFLSFSILLLLFALPSCEKDKDEDEAITESSILGKWEVQSMKTVGYADNVKLYEDTETFEADENVVEFLAGGNGKMYEYDEYYDDFTWDLNGKILTMVLPEEGEMDMDASLVNGIMTLEYSETYEEEGTEYKIEMTIKAKKL
jgi:hypothetical protein